MKNQFERELENIQQKEAINELKMSLPSIIESISLSVKIQKAYFEELVNSGFTEEQALGIVKAHGVDIGRASQMRRCEE